MNLASEPGSGDLELQSRSLCIEGREFSERNVCIIAEVAQAHDGSLGLAHAYIDAIADAGADAVKFQTHIAAAESTRREAWRIRFSQQDATRYDYWKRLQFTPEQWHGLRQHAAKRNLIFLSSPFSPEAVDLLRELKTPAWKVASGEVSNTPLLTEMLKDRLPMLISSGLSDFDELSRTVALCRSSGATLALLQCTTAYPCPPERVHLGRMVDFEKRFQLPIGLSDHSGTIFPTICATTLGATVVEVHVTFDRRMFGPDIPASITIDELAVLVRGVRFVSRMNSAPHPSPALTEEQHGLRAIFGKSLVARHDLRAGQTVQESDIACKKPGDGIPADRLNELVGRKIRRDIVVDEPLEWNDFQ